jgi:uncharacterized protein (TIGR00369 family)
MWRSFLERFWDMVPRSGDGWAECTLKRGLHVGNRVGDVQGGILLGLAAQSCSAVFPDGWSLVDISAQFMAAAKGQTVIARADVTRAGRNVASIECRIRDVEGAAMLLAHATLVRDR